MGGSSVGSILPWLGGQILALTFRADPQQSSARAEAEVQGWGWGRVSQEGQGVPGGAEGRFQPRPLKSAKGQMGENKFRCRVQRASGGL